MSLSETENPYAAALMGLAQLPAAIGAHVPEIIGLSLLKYFQIVMAEFMPSASAVNPYAVMWFDAIEKGASNVAVTSYLSAAGVVTYPKSSLIQGWTGQV